MAQNYCVAFRIFLTCPNLKLLGVGNKQSLWVFHQDRSSLEQRPDLEGALCFGCQLIQACNIYFSSPEFKPRCVFLTSMFIKCIELSSLHGERKSIHNLTSHKTVRQWKELKICSEWYYRLGLDLSLFFVLGIFFGAGGRCCFLVGWAGCFWGFFWFFLMRYWHHHLGSWTWCQASVRSESTCV